MRCAPWRIGASNAIVTSASGGIPVHLETSSLAPGNPIAGGRCGACSSSLMRGQRRAMSAALSESASGQARCCSCGQEHNESSAGVLPVSSDADSQLHSGARCSCGSSAASAPRAARSLAAQPPGVWAGASRGLLKRRAARVRTPTQHAQVCAVRQKLAQALGCGVEQAQGAASVPQHHAGFAPDSNRQRRTSSARTRVSRGASAAAAASLRGRPERSSVVGSLTSAST